MKQLDRYQDMRPDNLVNALRRIEILECALKDSGIDLEKHRALLIHHLSIIDPLREELSEALENYIGTAAAYEAVKDQRDALQDKLTALEKQEPVAWRYHYVNGWGQQVCTFDLLPRGTEILKTVPVYEAAGAAQKEQI